MPRDVRLVVRSFAEYRFSRAISLAAAVGARTPCVTQHSDHFPSHDMEAVYIASTQYSMLQTRTSICALENTCINYRFFKCTERGLLRTVLSTCHEISDGRNDASR